MADTSHGMPADADPAVATAVDIAIATFAREGFDATKLQSLADGADMSKRMLYYHFGDKRGLYRAALARAVRQLTPPQEVLSRSSSVPVEGMRRFVDAFFHRFLHHPDAARLVLRENLDPVLADGDDLQLQELSEVVLHVERLLLLGQDSGAFRPGISADDILVMLCSLSIFREGNMHTTAGVLGVDLANQRNTEGLRRMAIDMVLAFLTSNIPPSGYGSYLEPAAAPKRSDDEPAEFYEVDGAIY